MGYVKSSIGAVFKTDSFTQSVNLLGKSPTAVKAVRLVLSIRIIKILLNCSMEIDGVLC
jgi:hypothetical protein